MSLIDKFLRSRNSNPLAEMSFMDHIEELRWHLVRSIIAILIGAIIVFVNIEWIFDNLILGPTRHDFISYRVMCKVGNWLNLDMLCMKDVDLKFQNTVLSGQFMMSFSVSLMLGFIIAFPYIFHQFWVFIRPALKQVELQYARGIVFWTSSLFFIGVLFAYYVIAPFTINFFATYQISESFENIITIGNYYDTMSEIVLGMGLVFQLPVLVYFLSKTGIISPKFLREKRNYAIVIIMIIAAVITPPDMFTIWLVALPLIVLYEIGIVISGRVNKSKEDPSDQYKY